MEESNDNLRDKSVKKIEHLIEILTLYAFVLLSLLINLISLGDKHEFSDWFKAIREVGLAIASSSIAVSCTIPYLKSHKDIKLIMDIKKLLIMFLGFLYFIIYFMLNTATIFNFVFTLILLILIIFLSVVTLKKYFAVQDEINKLIEEIEEKKLKAQYATLPGNTGKIMEDAHKEVDNINVLPLDLDSILNDSENNTLLINDLNEKLSTLDNIMNKKEEK